MARWDNFVADAPELAGRVRGVLDHRKHKVLATLRKDGSPRLSGIEVELSGGEMRIGMMPGSLKARDVERDPRIAILAVSDDPPDDSPSSWRGDARVSGRVGKKLSDDPKAGTHFALDIDEIVLTRVGTPADHLLIETWRPGRGARAVKRK